MFRRAFYSFCTILILRTGKNPSFVSLLRCACENCQIMERAESCVCCQEIEQVKNKPIEAVSFGECEEQPKCITQHPGFHLVCINRWVLDRRAVISSRQPAIVAGYSDENRRLVH